MRGGRSLANVVAEPSVAGGGGVSGARSNRSLAARRGRPYDKGRGFVAQALWVAVSTLIFTQVWCPNRLRCALLRWFGANIGHGVLIKHRVRVQWPWKLSIGDNSWVGTDAELYNIDNIVIGSDVCISQHVYLCTGSHDRRSPTFEFDNGPIVVEDGAWLCARSTVLRGVTIGANSVVGGDLAGHRRRSAEFDRSSPPAIIGDELMRILQVVTLLSPDGAYGGPARVALNQSAELIRRGHDVTVAAATRGYRVPPTELNGVPVRLFAARTLLPGTGFAGMGAPASGQVVSQQRGRFRRRSHPLRPRSCRSARGSGRAATPNPVRAADARHGCAVTAIPSPDRSMRFGRERYCGTRGLCFI